MKSGGARPVIAVLTRSWHDRPPGLEPLEKHIDFRFTDEQGLPTALEGAEGLLLWDFFSSALRNAWPYADSLRWIHIAAAGVDKLLFDELNESDVVVTNARGVFDRPIAEYVLGVILARAKRLFDVHDRQQIRHWQHQETDSVQYDTALIVGTGAIGREIARVLSAVGLHVRGVGRSERHDDPDFGDVIASADLVDHIGWADHLVIAAPLTEQTRKMVDHRVLAAMKNSAHVINIGRGETVDEDALVEALGAGSISSASLDVFAVEPLADDSPLWSMPNVFVSPHMSGDARGWLETLARQFVDNALSFLDGQVMNNVVDKRLGFVPPATNEGSGR